MLPKHCCLRTGLSDAIVQQEDGCRDGFEMSGATQSNSCAGAAVSWCLHLPLRDLFRWCCYRLQETADRDEANAALVQHLKAETDSRLHALQDAVTAAVEQQQQESSTIGSAVAEFLQQKDADLQALKVRSGLRLSAWSAAPSACSILMPACSG